MSLPNDRETKIYVAGLPWITKTEGLRNYFEQFGEIVYANVVCDRATKRSKGFGFVTFKEAESAKSACEDPNPTIDGRKTSCKLAYLGARVHNNLSNQNVYGFSIFRNQYYWQYYQLYYQHCPWFSTYPY
ncbi:hypothetical protein N665_1269s0008 [Sinapis alba]|nr:hypothetical protein N665_1269s0008 [Sinapis alba]